MRRILVVTPQFPYPPHQGASLRNYYIIKGLSQKHRVTLLSFVDPGRQPAKVNVGPLAQRLQGVHLRAGLFGGEILRNV